MSGFKITAPEQLLILGDEEIAVLIEVYSDFPRTMFEADFTPLPAFKKHAQLFRGGPYKGQTGLKLQYINGDVRDVFDFKFLEGNERCTYILKIF